MYGNFTVILWVYTMDIESEVAVHNQRVIGVRESERILRELVLAADSGRGDVVTGQSCEATVPITCSEEVRGDVAR